MKIRIIAALFVFLSGSLLVSKELIIPNNIQIKENIAIESVLCNLADSEIYQPIDLQVIDDFMIIGNAKPSEIVKLDLNGNVLIRKAKEGRGPGEFIFCLSPRKLGENILFVDINNKILFYDLHLNFIKEVKLALYTRDFVITKNNNLIFPERYGSEFYLSRYSIDGKLLKKIGVKEEKYNPKDEFSSYNRPRLLAYDKSRDIIWCDNLGKYELRSFKDDNKKDLIKPEKELFNKYKTIDKDTGEKVMELDGRSIRLISINDRLFNFFHKKEIAYVDVFEINKFVHIKKIRFKNKYVLISIINQNEFYGISYDEEGDPLLYKIEISGFK